MSRRNLLGFVIPIAVVLLAGCAAVQQIAALRSVSFAFANVSGVRIAGVPVTEGLRWSSLGVTDVARIAGAITTKNVPVDLVAHVSATNPAQNKVPARLVTLGWKLFVDDRPMLDGTVNEPVAITPGTTADVPVAVRFDLLAITGGGARDLFETAMSLAGYGTTHKELRLELVPTIDTSLGPITYPSPIVVRH